MICIRRVFEVRHFFLLAVLLGSDLISPTNANAEATKPNIIFFLIDDFGWADLGSYGSKFHQTPNLDRLAAEGMRFTDAYAACPVCSPTRAAVMTGRYPARFNLTDWLPGRPDQPSQKLSRPKIRQELPLEEVTIAEALKPAGYVCGSIGKWHLGGAGFEPTKQGFDINIAGDAAGSPLSYFAPYVRNNRKMVGLENSPEGEYLTDRLTTEAIKFIDQNKEKPFFLYLPHYTVHTPLNGKKELVEKYKALKASGTQTNAIYAAMIESLDEGVGRILSKLDELKLTEKTIVIFTSDNGGLSVTEGPNTPATSNAPLREGKGYLYEGGIRVPLLVKWPGVVKPGSVSAEPVCSIDFLPTILEITGQAMTKDSAALDGVSLVPVLKQSGALNREALYWHYPHYSNQGGRPGCAIREGDWKLIEFYENGVRELFNIKSDLQENNNVAEKNPERVAAMGTKLAAWRTAVDAKMMSPNPNYAPNPQAADGLVTLHAKTADVHGVMLRYEPQPNKNTLGFWVRADDWASWEFTVTKPGKFTVEILQGCGKGNGGSEVTFSVDEQSLSTTIVDTGHFQNFVPREIGTITLEKPGRYTLNVKPVKKAAAAVMDLRQVILKPTK